MTTTKTVDEAESGTIGRRQLLGLLGLGLGGSLLIPQTAVAASTATATELVNVRAKPSTTAEVLGQLAEGDKVTVISTATNWTRIRFEGGSGYVARRYLRAAPAVTTEVSAAAAAVLAGSVRITTAAVNLREGPALSQDVIKVLPKRTRVTMTGQSRSGYAEVVTGISATGWISTRYLAATTGLPAVVGTRVATEALDIRTASGANARTVDEVKKGTSLSVTGVVANARAQIVYEENVRWVTAKYLATPATSLPTAPDLPKITGYRYATADLNIRSTYTTKYTLITEVPVGTRLAITGVIKKKRMQVVYDNAVRWVTAKYLSKTKPEVDETPKYAVEKGLKPNAIKIHRAVLTRYPSITTFYGVRRDALPDHPSGRALDIMIPNYKSAKGKKMGHDLSRWLRANAAAYGVNYVIWDQHIWNNERAGDGWRYMANRGGDSANHKNHVHVTVYAKGYSPV